MLSFNDVLVQIFQPYFFFSLVFLSIAFFCVKIFLRFNPSISRRIQSVIWLVPLLAPVIILLCAPPQTLINAAFSPLILAPAGTSLILLPPNIYSFTGLICIIGIAIAAGYFVLMMVLGKRIALKRFKVVTLAQNEYVSIQEKVKETARKIGIPEPKVGLIDDLIPNAFTVGYGRNTVVVFSLGLLKMFNAEEMTAVISHELAHIKAKDYLFRTFSYALNFLSFFNPLAYFASAQAQKERELLADEKGVALLGKPLLMANVFAKLETITPNFHKARLSDRLAANLFLVSPLAHRPAILASHPRLSHRIQNIQTIKCKPAKNHRKMFSAIFLLGILLSIALLAGYSTVEAQKTYLQNESANLIKQYKVIMYNSSLPYSSQTGILFPDIDHFEAFTSGQSRGFLDATGKSATTFVVDIQTTR